MGNFFLIRYLAPRDKCTHIKLLNEKFSLPSSHGFSWYLWFPSKFYLNVEEEEFLHYFTYVCNYSPIVIHHHFFSYIKAIQ